MGTMEKLLLGLEKRKTGEVSISTVRRLRRNLMKRVVEFPLAGSGVNIISITANEFFNLIKNEDWWVR